MHKRSLFSELRERKVVQAAAIYGAVAWGVTEVVVTIVEQLFLPQWVSTLAVIFFVVGFPVAMFLSWTFDLTAAGIQRTDVKSGRGTASIAFSMLLLVTGTAGLFFLIKPALDNHTSPDRNVAIAPNSVAVLPFDFAGPDPDDSYLGPGLSDELRDQLARVEGLRIAARSSSIAVLDQVEDAKSMALKLGVSHLLEGNMRRQGNLLKVSVQLIDGNSGLAVWQKTFERGRRELLNVQQDVAQSIAERLLPDSAPTIAGPITQDATAHDKMILARHYEQQVLERETVDQDLLERAVRLYREAAELDPGSALAQSRLAGALLYLGDIDDAEAHASKALLLDPTLAEVQHTFGKILFARGTPNMGEPLARAVELNPNLPDAIADYAFWHWFNVSTDGVADLYQRALDLDPLNVARYAALGQFLALNDRPDDARALAERLRALLDTPTAYRAIEKLYDLVGDVDHAIAWTIKARDAEPDNPLHVQRLAELYTDIGDYKTAEALEPDLGVGLQFKMRRYEEMIVKAEDLLLDHPEDLQLRVYLGFAYNANGQYESAIRIIETSGFLDAYSHSRRNQEEFQGFGVLLDAAYGSGESDRARELAAWEMATHYESDTSYWWVAFENACTHAILGNDDEVYRLLKRTLESDTLIWEPMLRDHQCFKRFTNDTAYLAVVRHFEQLREMLRTRLPTTLAQYGIVL